MGNCRGPRQKDADLVLKGQITSIEMQNIEYGDLGRPVKKRLRIRVAARLIDMKRKLVIWRDGNIQAFQEFSDVIPPIKQESFVYDEVLDELSKRISAKVLSGWYSSRLTRIEKGKKQNKGK